MQAFYAIRMLPMNAQSCMPGLFFGSDFRSQFDWFGVLKKV
ncbi:hypothetical protein FLJC2902T_11240 [Flavobacterium limnosediminis JC2902]|uniref:Uncharacterized protein n=1 Tax=Flavobacterium limnosediminis JC2902 TaxID=1341181 RepID=V6SR18_9FLAO|nr:hypothetical protein FLJC2902T_11240 [Flavobacterium limnosediminis JC2902]